MKVIVFGVGNYYRDNKKKLNNFNDIEIIALTDNNSSLWNNEVDGYLVISPNQIHTFEYDKVLIMSIYVCQIYEQLIALEVDNDKIITWELFYKEILRGNLEIRTTIGCDIVNKQKVLIVTQELNYDGGTLAVIYAAMALKSNGILVALSASGGNEKIINEVRENQIEIIICPTLPYVLNEDKKWIQQFDIVIVNLFTMIESAYEINKFRPVLWWVHEASLIYEAVKMRYITCLNVQKKSEISIYAVSNIAKRNFNKEMGEMVEKTLMLGIPDAATEIRHNKLKDRKIIFAIIGTVYRVKAQGIFIRAAEMVDKGKAEFWIIGRSSDQKYFQALQEMATGISSIKFLGELTRKEMNRIFQTIDVVVCASHEETLSMTIIEGMMHRKICITTESTGIAEYIENGVNGFVIPPNDASMLAEKMSWIVENRDKTEKLKRAARNTYEKYFTLDVLGENLKKALNETETQWRK